MADAEQDAGKPAPKSDLKTRTLSAIVMVALAGGALWAGGWVWLAFVIAVAVGVLWEWEGLARAITATWWARLAWFVAGVVYVGVAAEMLLMLRAFGRYNVLVVVLAVIGTDIGAYFAGRTFGGPKIAQKISPSKTWSGLAGGMLGAGLMIWLGIVLGGCELNLGGDCGDLENLVIAPWPLLVPGAFIAIIAQTGDFFESWMKRRAGLKDSGTLIPGHGGLFDRVDGLLAVLFVAGILTGVGRFL